MRRALSTTAREKNLSAPKMPIEEIQAYSSRSPGNTWLGVRVLEASDTGVVVEIPWREEFVGSPDARTMHGGILAAAVDVAAGLSLFAILGRAGPTIDMRVDFHRGVKAGALRGVGKVLRAGGTITSVEAMIYDADGKLAASGRCVFFTAQR